MKDLQRGHEGLLAAIVLQAIKDRQAGSKKQRRDAITFIQSDGFDWLWELVTDSICGMPDAMTAKQTALTTQISFARQVQRQRVQFAGGVPA